ncbi:SDR family oxidoreductase [Nonomuraea recticatena]|uniref:Uncharacterized protein n=1 Tax=Nonomuraea recticatena TaxID=46178 RepID=A0ABP6FUB0_9ACTN
MKHVGGDALGVSAEVSDERSLERAFQLAGTVDHVLVTAGGFGGGALESTPGSEVRHLVDSRVRCS